MKTTTTPPLKLNGYTFAELFQAEGLQRLDQDFLRRLQQHNPALHTDLLAYRHQTQSFPALAVSELLLAVAPVLEEFIAEMFAIKTIVQAFEEKTLTHNPVSAFKKFFVLRRAKKNLLNAENLSSFQELDLWLCKALQNAPLHADDKELAVALLATQFLNDPEKYHQEIERLTEWCIQALLTPEGKAVVAHWTSFRIPERLDYEQLVATHSVKHDKLHRLVAADQHLRQRDGFKLTDPRMTQREVQDEVNYCIYCHDHDGDFCSKGFPVKKNDPSLGLKKNPLDVTLTGCPLEEKISEMHSLKRDGLSIAALAMVMVDNPMCPATGHRICNDCMKACIYQKQEPVNIPQIETRVLTDVLEFPWGVEIYDLLTRWNPLRQQQWVSKSYNGLKVLIAGMGPAGFTLAHHLLQEGFAVVGVDGLKIEPLPSKFIHEPIHRFDDLKESLDERIMSGFGGVAEYGITVRWDKNFLKLIYISLMRRPHFQVYGGVRFGGTLQVEDAWQLGFQHFAIAVGAGLPRALNIPHSLAPGMRQASDFLMTLQLTGAAKTSSLANLQIRLPAVVIGGGLTGVDTATEVQAYYITQVEKTLQRYEILATVYGEQAIRETLDPASSETLNEFLMHGKAVRDERARAKLHNTAPDFIKLLRSWGGVTIVYRRIMRESPAYINNHEELKKALEEGIYYAEALEPTAADLNQFGHVETLICHKRLEKENNLWEATTEEVRIPARSIFVATGTQPNIAYEFEHRGTFKRLGFQYHHYEDQDGELTVPHGITHCKESDFGPFTSYNKDDHRVSLIGDTHPVFHGSVVKAIASGMRTYPKILQVLKNKLTGSGDTQEYQRFAAQMHTAFSAYITHIERRGKKVIELTICAPMAVKHYQPGQFFRLQNYETSAKKVCGTLLQTEALTLFAAGCDVQKGTVTLVVMENSASTRLCATLNVGEAVSLMGPTGARSKIAHEHETVLIIGEELSMAHVRSYGPALRAAGNKVIYLGNFSSASEVYCQQELENSTDLIIWSTRSGKLIECQRPQDQSISASAMEALRHYAHSNSALSLADVDRIYLIGNTQLLRDFQDARQTTLREFLIKQPLVFGSVYSTMQCMLKGVCAQCLQWQVDPETGQRTKAVFACSWQDQPLELIDFDNLDERRIQNAMQEKLSNLWLDYLFEQQEVTKI